MRILIIEDNDQLAHCLALELEQEGFSVETARSGAEGLQRLRQGDGPGQGKQPSQPGEPPSFDALIIDWDLPDFSGLEVYERLANQPQRPPALMLTGRDRVEDRVTALNRGFDDYLIKPFSFDELIARLRAITRRQNQAPAPSRVQDSPLSEREQDVLKLIARGQSNSEIAETLFLSTETVKSHVKSILTKLHAKDRTHALVLALQQGLVAVANQDDPGG